MSEQPQRIQQRRTKGWRKPENTVSVARPSRWGNPFPVSEYGLDLSLQLFSDAMRGTWNPSRLDQNETDEYWHTAYNRSHEWRKRLGSYLPADQARFELRGKNLMCFCPLDQPCHADVLLELANGES